jgi:hypothetical protein
MIRICTELEPVERAWEGLWGAVENTTKVKPPHELPAKHQGEIDSDRPHAESSEHRRRRMIRDTERYLSDPRSLPWPLRWK